MHSSAESMTILDIVVLPWMLPGQTILRLPPINAVGNLSTHLVADPFAHGKGLNVSPLLPLRFSHQDQPYADGQGRHHCRSGACASGGAKCRVAGPTPSSRDRPRQRLA